MRAGRRYVQGFFWVFWFAMVWVVEDRLGGPVTGLLDALTGGTRLDGLWTAAKAHPVATFVGLGFWFSLALMVGDILSERLFGLVDVELAPRAGSKQFFAVVLWPQSNDPAMRTRTRPYYYILQPWFLNHSTNETAEQVSASVDLWGPDRIQRDRFCQWAQSKERDAPTETGFTSHATTTDIFAGGNIPARLNVAIRYDGEPDAYVFTNENKNAYSDLRHPDFALRASTYLLRIRLRGRHVKKTVWMKLSNRSTDDKPYVKRVRILERLYWFVSLSLMRRSAHRTGA
jgi:hypothetical protein